MTAILMNNFEKHFFLEKKLAEGTIDLFIFSCNSYIILKLKKVIIDKIFIYLLSGAQWRHHGKNIQFLNLQIRKNTAII